MTLQILGQPAQVAVAYERIPRQMSAQNIVITGAILTHVDKPRVVQTLQRKKQLTWNSLFSTQKLSCNKTLLNCGKTSTAENRIKTLTVGRRSSSEN